MSQPERFYRIDQLLQERGVVAFQALQDALEVSRATLRRDITYMRDRLNAPIVFDSDAGGYRYEKTGKGAKFNLPGLWFSSDEILALMTMYQMLDGLDTGGLLGPHIRPLMARLSALLDSSDSAAKEILRRVRLVTVQQRRMRVKWFEVVGSAVVHRRRLRIDYYTRSRDERSTRDVSPLRLTHYRSNWYLDAWCHKEGAIRMFSVDAIKMASVLDEKAKEVSLARVDEELGAGYGIFRRARIQWAKLKFNAEAARWVRDEVWHERQVLEDTGDGGIILSVPFSDGTELEMDILRHGDGVEVLKPPSLRRAVTERLKLAARLYE